MARAQLVADAEVLPEADRFEDYPHPRDTAHLFGYAKAEAEFSAALNSETSHHAWLIGAPAGSGKATLAYRVARAALAKPDERGLFGDGLDVDRDTPTARQISVQAHPGLLVIRRTYDLKAKRFSASIPVDEVRRLKGFLALSAEAGSRRMVIVDSADELNTNAANALLKSLEEPPARTLFLILSAAPGRLLPTIRSRCRSLHLPPLRDADLRLATSAALHAVGKPEPKDNDWQELSLIAAGSVRRALALIEGGGLGLEAHIEKIFSDLPRLDMRAAHKLADELQPAAQEQRFTLFFDLFQDALARLIRAEATGEGRRQDRETANRLIGRQRLATFAELWETLAREKADALALNLDRKALILASLLRLEAASRA